MTQSLTLQANIKQPYWMLAHTIQNIGSSLMKLIQIQEMQYLYDDGADDSKFIIGSKSLDFDIDLETLSTSIQTAYNNENFVFLDSKSNDPEDFWKIFHKLHRPIIFYKTHDGLKSLYTYENAIEFVSIDINSPHKYKIYGKRALIGIAMLIVEHLITKAVDYGIDNSIEIYNKLIPQHIQQDTPLRNLPARVTLEREDKLYEHNKLDIIVQNQEAMKKQIEALESNNALLLRRINEIRDEEPLYLDFLKNEKNKIEKELEKKLEKRPLIVKDFEII